MIELDELSIDSSIESILTEIAEVFYPDIEFLEELELNEGNERYMANGALFIPLNPDKFKSEKQISALRDLVEKPNDEYHENNLQQRLVYGDYGNSNKLAIIILFDYAYI